jgi:hypothetical protein
MKKSISILLAGSIVVTMSLASCKSKTSDTTIKTSVETAFKADPVSAGAVATVDKGVVTINGVCNDEAAKARAGEIAKGVKGVKEVINNCTVPPPAPVDVVVNADDAALNAGLTDALKDNPTVHYTLSDGKIVLTGEIAKSKWMKLKQTLDKLKSKGYDLTGLTIK